MITAARSLPAGVAERAGVGYCCRWTDWMVVRMAVWARQRVGLMAVLVIASFALAAQSALAAGWSVQSTENMNDPGGNLGGVSCTAWNACTAVSQYSSGGTTVTLAQAWNGSSWKQQSTPNPSGSTLSSLDAVSCFSADACTAVGFYQT